MTYASGIAYGGNGPLVLGVTWAEMGLALILVILRAKTASVCPPGQLSSGIFGLRWDFVWVIMAFAVALAVQSSITVSVRYGLGNHQDLLSKNDLVKANLWSWVAQVLAILDLVIARIAVIAFLLSIQGRTMYKSRYLLYFVGTIQALINIIEVGLIFRQCTPVEKLWDFDIPGTCDQVVICSQVGFAQGSIGAAADFFLAFYPIIIIGRLQLMKLSTKIGLCLLMGGGLIAGIAGINKTIAISSITHADDLTYAIARLDTWVLTEMWFIIIFGSIPVLRPFFIRFTQDIKSATGNSSKNKDNSHAEARESRSQQESWIQLNDDPQANFRPHGCAVASASHNADHTQRGTNGPAGRHIIVTKDTSVISERFRNDG